MAHRPADAATLNQQAAEIRRHHRLLRLGLGHDRDPGCPGCSIHRRARHGHGHTPAQDADAGRDYSPADRGAVAARTADRAVAGDPWDEDEAEGTPLAGQAASLDDRPMLVVAGVPSVEAASGRGRESSSAWSQ